MFRLGAFLVAGLLVPILADASVESSLNGIKSILLGSILPVFAALGLGFAGFGFFTGNPNAKQNLVYAISGTAVLFGAQSIVDLIQRIVH